MSSFLNIGEFQPLKQQDSPSKSPQNFNIFHDKSENSSIYKKRGGRGGMLNPSVGSSATFGGHRARK